MRKPFVALIASVALLFGGMSVASTAQAAPVSPSVVGPAIPAAGGAQLASMPSKGIVAPKGNPDDNQISTKAFVSCGAPPTACFSYAGQRQLAHAPSDGAAASLPITKAEKLPGDYHKLTEIAVQSADGQQTVEVGETYDAVVCGSVANSPCAFTFAWVNGNPLCYNGCGFTPAVGCAPYCMGSTLSGLVGTTKSFAIQHIAGGGGVTPGWWIAFDGVWRGAWPDSVWTGATPPSSFTQSEQTQIFGELAHANTPTQSDIASGVLAVSTTTGSLVSGYQLIVGGVGVAGAFNSTKVTTADRWNVVNVSPTSFRYGGPGGNENLPTVNPTCSGVGVSPTWGGYGSKCWYSNTAGGVPVTKVFEFEPGARNVCTPDMGKLDGQTTTPIRVFVNTMYTKVAWFRDRDCLGAHIDLDYSQTTLPAGWTNLDHASSMRWATPVVNHN